MAKKPTFHDHLILNRWLLSLFHKKDLATLKAQMGGDEYEGEAKDEQSGFFHQLTGVFVFRRRLRLVGKRFAPLRFERVAPLAANHAKAQ